MYLQKSARKWWASLKTKGIQPRTWRTCRLEMMKHFLTSNVRDDVLTAWRGLKMEKGETIQKYVDKFWDLHLKASVFEDIEFPEQRQQYCAGLPEDVRSYIMDQKPKFISEVIHHSMVFRNGGTERKLKTRGAYYERCCGSPEFHFLHLAHLISPF